MKKTKGFTLAELLVIILIIGLLISLTGYTITRVVKQSREKIKEQELTSLLDASKTYMNEVIEGDDSYPFEDGNYKGYDFINNLAKNCKKYKTCSYTSQDDINEKYSVELYIGLNSVKDYIDVNKYYDGKCTMYAYIDISKNKNGYFVVDGLQVKAASTTKAKLCVVTQ